MTLSDERLDEIRLGTEGYAGPQPLQNVTDLLAEVDRLREEKNEALAQVKTLQALTASPVCATPEAAHEDPPIEPEDLRPGDTLSLRVFDTRVGWEREHRTVVAVGGGQITLREDDREYTIAIDDDLRKRKLRLVRRATPEAGEGDAE